MPPDLNESMVLDHNDCCVKIAGAIIIEYYALTLTFWERIRKSRDAADIQCK